ncbi:hypothetical protein BH23PLA1_BH23PLA1_27480 [soil metagenome]
MVVNSNWLRAVLLILIPAILVPAVLLGLSADSRFEPLDERTLLSIRGADPENLAGDVISCDEVNEDPTGPQWGPANCLDGQECVKCDMPLNFGEEIGGDGDRLHQPLPIECGGDRIIGVCAYNPNFGTLFCDTSNSYIDGACGGQITEWRGQGEPPPDISDP